MISNIVLYFIKKTNV